MTTVRRAFVAVILSSSVIAAGCGGLSTPTTERWVTTENTNVDIDWDKINEAYRTAEGPEDFEQKVNEIYEGDEVISVAVEDKDSGTQTVTGFFDKNESGHIDEGEKIFSIDRQLKGEGQAQYQISGAGPYASYHSPFWDIASGMMLGSMLSNMFRPNYVPMYTRPYVTAPARAGALAAHRDSYRSQNPSRFPNHAKASRSGRSYGAKGGSFGGQPRAPRSAPARRSGGSFGVGTKSGRNVRVIRLDV